MTRLEELLNLADSQTLSTHDDPPMEEDQNPDKSDKEFDDLADRAVQAFDDLVDLGMNVEPKYTARIFEVASSMLSNAISAKSAKVNKNLRLMDLELKKQKMTSLGDTEKDITSESVLVSDRNSLLEQLKNLQRTTNV